MTAQLFQAKDGVALREETRSRELELEYIVQSQEQRGKKETLETLAVSLFALALLTDSLLDLYRPLWAIRPNIFPYSFAIVSMDSYETKYDILQHMIQLFCYDFNLLNRGQNTKNFIDLLKIESFCLNMDSKWFFHSSITPWLLISFSFLLDIFSQHFLS